jgi:hypothetical protein
MIHIAGPFDNALLVQRCTRCGTSLLDLRFAHRWRNMPWPEGARVEVTENYTSMRLDQAGPTCEAKEEA